MTLKITSLFTLFAVSGFLTGASAQTSGSRLPAVCEYAAQGGFLVPSDSDKYMYPSGYTRLDSCVQEYSFDAGKGTPTFKRVHTHDATGFLTNEDIRLWSTATSAFTPNSKLTFVKGPMGKLIEKTSQSWASSSQSYLNAQRFLYAYDTRGNLVEYIVQGVSGPSTPWRNVFRDSTTYNAQNMPTRVISQNWNNSSGTYVNNYRHDYTYDASGLHMLTDTFRWLDVPTGGWRNYGITTYALDASGRRATGVMMTWEAATATYDSFEHYTYAYDAFDNEISRTVQQWHPAQVKMVNSFQDTRSFNSFNQISTTARMYWDGSAFARFPATGAGKTIYYYESYVPAAVSPASAQSVRIKLSPNPVHDVLAIELQSAQAVSATIADMQGRVHQRFNGAPGGSRIHISVAGLPSGNYIVHVKGEHGGHTSQMISVAH